MLIVFDGQLLSTKDGSFTPDDGANKGQEFAWTELEFHSKQTGRFVLKTLAPVVVPETEQGKVRHWELEVEPRIKKGVQTFKVSKISGGKAS